MNNLVIISALVMTFSCASGCNREPEPRPTKVAGTVARCTHSVGLCNLPLFIATEDQAEKGYNIGIELTSVPDWGKHALALQKGDIEFSVTPFTNVMTAYANGVPLRIIAGSGMNGLRLVTAKNINSADDLKGKKIGTFRADTLEMMLYSYLSKNGLSYDDVEVVYFDDSLKMVTSFGAGTLDAMTHVEPYAQRALGERECRILATGEGSAVWGADHPDCVLVTTATTLIDSPDKCRALIRAILKAEKTINEDPEKAARRTAKKYFRAKVDDIVMAGKSQRPKVNILDSKDFMEERFEDLKKLGHISDDAEFDGLLALEFLEQEVSSIDDDSGGANSKSGDSDPVTSLDAE